MELIKPQHSKLVRGEPIRDLPLVRGQSYMAFVKVTPYYEAGNAKPILLKFNELMARQKKEQKEPEKQLDSYVDEEQLL